MSFVDCCPLNPSWPNYYKWQGNFSIRFPWKDILKKCFLCTTLIMIYVACLNLSPHTSVCHRKVKKVLCQCLVYRCCLYRREIVYLAGKNKNKSMNKLLYKAIFGKKPSSFCEDKWIGISLYFTYCRFALSMNIPSMCFWCRIRTICQAEPRKSV